jgi:hypothetical protein
LYTTFLYVKSLHKILFLYFLYKYLNINCTLENGLTVRTISSFYNNFFNFYETLPSDSPNFIKLRPGIVRFARNIITLSRSLTSYREHSVGHCRNKRDEYEGKLLCVSTGSNV